MADDKKPPRKMPSNTKDVDWVRVEALYRAGIRSGKSIAEEFGISQARISQKAKEFGWERDLGPKIRAQAQAKVDRKTAEESLNPEFSDPLKKSLKAQRRLTEAVIVEANATVQAGIHQRQRTLIDRFSRLVTTNLLELEQTGSPEGQGLIETLLAAAAPAAENETPDEAKARQRRIEQAMERLTSLPGRIDSGKRLMETYEKLFKIEREAYGITPDSMNPADERKLNDTEAASRAASILGQALARAQAATEQARMVNGIAHDSTAQ